MADRTHPPDEKGNGEGVWWQRGVGGPGQHPGCTCPMTGDSPAWHHDDCAAHDPDAREIAASKQEGSDRPEQG